MEKAERKVSQASWSKYSVHTKIHGYTLNIKNMLPLHLICMYVHISTGSFFDPFLVSTSVDLR